VVATYLGKGLASAPSVFLLAAPERGRSGLWIGLGDPDTTDVEWDRWLIGNDGAPVESASGSVPAHSARWDLVLSARVSLQFVHDLPLPGSGYVDGNTYVASFPADVLENMYVSFTFDWGRRLDLPTIAAPPFFLPGLSMRAAATPPVASFSLVLGVPGWSWLSCCATADLTILASAPAS
jgi:hypothetical protein